MLGGFGRALGQDVIEVYSAGSRPSGKVNPEAMKVMSGAGFDISKNQSRGFIDRQLRSLTGS
jgi:arsenate reductase